MIDDRLLLHVLAGMVFFVIGIRAYVIFSRWRTKYNLATLVVIIVLFVGTILNLLYPGRLKFVGETEVVILLAIIFIILLWLFLFYPEFANIQLQRRKPVLILVPHPLGMALQAFRKFPSPSVEQLRATRR